MSDCIPILQTEKLRYLGLAHDCVWNETVIVAIIIILGFILLIILIAVIEALSKSANRSNSGGNGASGYNISNREVLNINPEKHQKDVFNLVKDIFKIAGHKLIESKVPNYLEFSSGSNWMYGKINTRIRLSEVNNKLVLNISSSRSQNWSTPFKEKEIEDFNQNFEKIISDINKVVSKK